MFLLGNLLSDVTYKKTINKQLYKDNVIKYLYFQNYVPTIFIKFINCLNVGYSIGKVMQHNDTKLNFQQIW